MQLTVTDSRATLRASSPSCSIGFRMRSSIRHEPDSGPLCLGVPSDLRMPSEPHEVAAAFVHYVTGGQITESELSAFTEAYEHAQREGASA